MNDSIIALATPPLKSALAIIRLSGDGVFSLTDSFFSKKILDTQKRSLVYGVFSDNGKAIDEVMLLLYPSNNSMNGEEVVEISCHGSMVIVNQIIECYLAKGVRYATGGEFTSRAFYHGKMDLIEAEAVNDLINATTVEAKNIALLSVSGKTSKLIGPIKEDISSLLALLEVGIDFPEYDDEEQATCQSILVGCEKIRIRIAELIRKGKQGSVVRNGVKVALVGEPNVGKSSLLNALLEQNKAIVSSIPGTTRDVVEGDISLNGVPLHLLDTAGIRESSDAIEQLGIERSKKAIQECDLAIFVRDGSSNADQGENDFFALVGEKPHIVVDNKADRVANKKEGCIYVSALNGDISELKNEILRVLGVESDAFDTPSLSSVRELGLLRKIDEDLFEAQDGASQGLTMDLLSIPLQSAYNHARELLGEDMTHDLTDEIFSRFCVGK